MKEVYINGFLSLSILCLTSIWWIIMEWRSVFFCDFYADAYAYGRLFAIGIGDNGIIV